MAPQTPEEQLASMLANLPSKTGKPLAQWLALVAQSGAAKHGAIVKLLKEEHGVTHGYANLIAQEALQGATGAPAGDDLLAAQYAGAKAALRPIHDALLAAVSQVGPDVEVAPKKGYVSLRRSKQFALVQPSTATRVDVGLHLKGEPATDRLEAAGSWNAMVSHRVRLSALPEVDRQLVAWLRAAYDRA